MQPLANAVSPFEEMLSYETLWGARGASLKSISSLYRKHGVRPSELVKRQSPTLFDHELDELRKRVEAFLQGLSGFSVCIHGDFHYPGALRAVEHPLELFYYRGDIGLIESPAVSIVGTRKCSQEGRRRARETARQLTEAGYSIVSGLAAGIDTEAMNEAVLAGGRAIGVLGTPITVSYPASNRSFQELVAREHLLISQVPFYRYAQEPFRARRRYFPERNVTMAALSRATVIVEAGETSGTLTQARACLHLGKPLFVLESCFRQSGLTWPRRFVERGAIRARRLNDILERLTKERDEQPPLAAH